MRYLRPFDLHAAGPASDWLVTPEEEMGCTVRLRRGAGTTSPAVDVEADRYVLVLAGTATLAVPGKGSTVEIGGTAFLPAGAKGVVSASENSLWIEVRAPLPEGAGPQPGLRGRVITVDPAKFEGQGFAYQSVIDRSEGSQALRMNVLQVQPGSGSPDWHIHAFTQMYVITEGEMTVDIGCRRQVAAAGTLVVFPAGVVHRNFNAGTGVERHVTLLVPEPAEDAIFDYAITIHDEEAEILKGIPA